MNYSRQREIIFDTLRRHAVHPTAERLYNIIKGEQPDSNIGIATVYRNLRRMANSGSIKKISGLEEAEHFDHNTHTHYHFLCKNYSARAITTSETQDSIRSTAPSIVLIEGAVFLHIFTNGFHFSLKSLLILKREGPAPMEGPLHAQKAVRLPGRLS